MHQLERRAGVDDSLVVGVSSGTDETPVAERWAQALAAGLDHPADLVERTGQVAVEGGPPLAFGGDEADDALGDPPGDGRQAGGWFVAIMRRGSRAVRRGRR